MIGILIEAGIASFTKVNKLAVPNRETELND